MNTISTTIAYKRNLKSHEFVPAASCRVGRLEMKVKRNKRLNLICFKTLQHNVCASNSESEGLIGDKYISYHACKLLHPTPTQTPIQQTRFHYLR